MIAEDTTPTELMKLSTMSRLFRPDRVPKSTNEMAVAGTPRTRAERAGDQPNLSVQAAGDDLEQGQQGGDAGQDQGREEEHAEEGPTGHHRDDLREGHEGEDRAGQALDLGDAHAALVRHEANGAEDANAREDLKRGVRKAGDQSGARQVRLGLEVGGVGQHDTEAHGQRVEDLREGGQPHVGVGQRAPVRREEGVEPSTAPGRKSARTTSARKRITRSGRKTLFAASTPLDRPRPMTKSTSTHTRARGIITDHAGAQEKVSPGTTCKKESVKKVVGSAPQASFTE